MHNMLPKNVRPRMAARMAVIPKNVRPRMAPNGSRPQMVRPQMVTNGLW